MVEVKNSTANKLTLTLFENTIYQIAKINGHAVEINQFTAELIEQIVFDTSAILLKTLILYQRSFNAQNFNVTHEIT